MHQVTSNTAADEYPCIDPNDNFVVWQSTLPAKDSEIYLWNVNTHATSALTSNSTDDQYPKVYGDYVVWQGTVLNPIPADYAYIQFDYVTWLEQYSHWQTFVIPEPASAVLLALGAGVLLRRRREC